MFNGEYSQMFSWILSFLSENLWVVGLTLGTFVVGMTLLLWYKLSPKSNETSEHDESDIRFEGRKLYMPKRSIILKTEAQGETRSLLNKKLNQSIFRDTILSKLSLDK